MSVIFRNLPSKTMVRYKVTLTKEEHEECKDVLSKGKHSSQRYRNACVLINTDEGPYGQKLSNEQIAQVLQINPKTVERVKQRFVEEGFDDCMDRKPYPKKEPKKADGDFEAHLIALSCSEAPEGYARWSLRMLADKMVELEYTDSISHETVRQVLKKTKSNRGGSKVG
jgi:transposase